MASGEKAFRNTTLRSLLASFILPLLILPYGVTIATLMHGSELFTLSKLEGINRLPTEAFLGLTFIKAVLVTLFMIGTLYAFAKFMDRAPLFFDFLSASNWVTIPKTFLSLPLLYMMLSGSNEWISIYAYACLLILYDIALSSFIIARMLNIPLELGIAWGIFGLLISETANKILNLIGSHYTS